MGDALGSVRQTLDGTGNVLATTSYDPWGGPQYGLLAPFGVTGELHAQDRVYLRARWYDPGNGTLTSRDPWQGCSKTPYSLHPYQYAYSDPVRLTDPSGECVIALYYRPAFGRIHHIDVVVNDCDGFGHDQSRLCDRDPGNTVTIFWGGPEISPDQVTAEETALGLIDIIHPWGQVVAASASYATYPDSGLLPESNILLRAMEDNAATTALVRTVLFNAEPCDPYSRAMERFKQQVMDAHIPYNPNSRNSNGVAYGYLQAAGIAHPNLLQHRAPVRAYAPYIFKVATGEIANPHRREPKPWERFIPPLTVPTHFSEWLLCGVPF